MLAVKLLRDLAYKSQNSIGYPETKEEVLLYATASMLEDLHILSIGCEKHPAYRAKKQPRIACTQCLTMWQAVENLKFSRDRISSITE